MDLNALTSRKVAGIPVIYLALAIGVVALYGAFKLKPSAPDTAPTDAATDEGASDYAGDGTDTSQPVFSATPTITQPSGVVVGTGSVTAVSGADTNALWQRRTIDWLRQNGYDISTATQAINKYLSSEELSQTEAAARDKAVQQFGLPPEDIPNSPVTPAPPPIVAPVTPGPAIFSGPPAKQGTPPTNHTVHGNGDNSVTDLCKLYYGRSTYIEWNLLKAWNPGKALTAPIPNDTRVHIPKFVNPVYYKATSATRGLYAIASKNGVSAAFVQALNPGKNFPVAVGTQVRVH